MNKFYTLKIKKNLITYRDFKPFSEWKMELLDDNIKVDKKLYQVDQIESFLFDIGDFYTRGYRSIEYYHLIGVVYIKLKNKPQPQSICFIRNIEKRAHTDSKCYDITLKFVKMLSEKYEKPYRFSYGLNYENIDYNGIVAFIFIPFVLIILLIIFFK